MPWLSSLYARLALALLGIVTLAGGAFLLVEQFATRNYHEEITQRLNASIAMYVTGERQLITAGLVNQAALEQLAAQAMVINPTVEIYLLDTKGRILAHGLPDGTLRNESVDLGPVQSLIAGQARMPLRGTDPVSNRAKVFSAHPVMDGEVLQGYLYAILGGQKYDELAHSSRGSYVQQVSLGAIVAIIVIASGAGLLIFSQLTRRLRALTTEVRRFTESGFDVSAIGPLAMTGSAAPADEISQLQQAFSSMAGQIRRQFERLEETDRLRRELVSNVSHDLRTPLSSMQGYVETLLLKNDQLGEAERLRFLEITLRHTQRLGRLIGDLFELSKLEAAVIQPELEQFSLGELLQDIASEFELEAQQRGIRLTVDGARSSSVVVADIGLMQRVLENLLRNALKFTPNGGTVILSLAPGPRGVKVAVADTGRGIAPEQLERVFERYYQAADGEAVDPDSTGLGLAIVRRILDLHGSRITVSSTPGAGTCFEFELPSRKVA